MTKSKTKKTAQKRKKSVKVAQDLAAAFLTIERHRDYLPKQVYSEISDARDAFTDEAQWQFKPNLLRKILPPLVKAAIKNGAR